MKAAATAIQPCLAGTTFVSVAAGSVVRDTGAGTEKGMSTIVQGIF